MAGTSSIHFTIVDGQGNPIDSQTEVLVRLLNGAVELNAIWEKGNEVTLQGIPFTDAGRDAYHVFASAQGYHDTATPYRVLLRAGKVSEALLMAIPKNAAFHFLPWEEFAQEDPRIVNVFGRGAADAARQYSDLAEAQNRDLGALIGLLTAIRDVVLQDGSSPLDPQFFWQVMWDELAPDRFYAWVDARLANLIQAAPDFSAESAPWLLHKGIAGKVDPATRSWKQTILTVTNIQFTFHETTRSQLKDDSGRMVDCVVVEPDIDLYQDLLAHGLLEVLPNAITGGKTNPLAVYPMRWMATREKPGAPQFSPPVTIEPLSASATPA